MEVNEEKPVMEVKIEEALRSRIQHFKDNAEYVFPDIFSANFLVSIDLMCNTTLIHLFAVILID